MPISLREAGFWLAVASCLIAQLAIVRSVFVSRGTPSSHTGPRSGIVIELSWAVLPALGLAWMLWLTWQKIHAA